MKLITLEFFDNLLFSTKIFFILKIEDLKKTFCQCSLRVYKVLLNSNHTFAFVKSAINLPSPFL